MEENMVTDRSPIGPDSSSPARIVGTRAPDPGWVGLPSDARRQERPQDRAVLLFSGGLDSLCAWFLLDKPDALYVTTGAPWEANELETIDRLSQRTPGLTDRLSVEAGSDLSGVVESDGHIPYRNIWLVLAAATRGWDTIYLGALKGETSRDKTDRFAKESSALLSYAERRRVSVRLPFRGATKTELVRRFRSLPVPHGDELLRETRSCYDPTIRLSTTYVGCGRCLACLRRWVAMANNGLFEPYRSNPKDYAESLATGGETMAALARYGPRVASFGDAIGAIKNHLELRGAIKR